MIEQSCQYGQTNSVDIKQRGGSFQMGPPKMTIFTLKQIGITSLKITQKLTHLLQINYRVHQIVGCIIEKRQHGRSDEFWTVLDQRLSVNTLYQDLQTPDSYSYIRTKSSKS